LIAAPRKFMLPAAIVPRSSPGRLLTHCVADFKGTPGQPLDQGELRGKFFF
jgi:hypothetical protein